jgi:hypothetical protein
VSHVADVFLLTDTPVGDLDPADPEGDLAHRVSVAVAPALNGATFAAIPLEALPRLGHKVAQCVALYGAFNYLDVPTLVERLRSLDWPALGVDSAQLVVQDEHDSGFGLVDVWRDPAAAPAWALDDAHRRFARRVLRLADAIAAEVDHDFRAPLVVPLSLTADELCSIRESIGEGPT